MGKRGLRLKLYFGALVPHCSADMEFETTKTIQLDAFFAINTGGRLRKFWEIGWCVITIGVQAEVIISCV